MMQTRMSDRVAKLKQMQNDVKPSLSAERAKLATEAIEAHAFEPPVLQKAYMLSHILRNMTVFIQDGELVVGNQADKPRSAPVFPEFTSEWIVDEIDDFATRKSDPLTLTAEDRATLLEVLPRWKGKSFDKIVDRELPEEVKHAEESGVMTVGNRDCSTGHVLPDYFNLLPRGLNYYKAQCQKKIDETVFHEPAQRGHDEALVRERIHELAEVRDLIIVPGDVPVGEVGQARDDVHGQRHIAAAREAPVQDHQKHGDHQYAGDCQFVCGCHGHGKPHPFCGGLKYRVIIPWRRRFDQSGITPPRPARPSARRPSRR